MYSLVVLTIFTLLCKRSLELSHLYLKLYPLNSNFPFPKLSKGLDALCFIHVRKDLQGKNCEAKVRDNYDMINCYNVYTISRKIYMLCIQIALNLSLDRLICLLVSLLPLLFIIPFLHSRTRSSLHLGKLFS